jgi:hypothetical protein
MRQKLETIPELCGIFTTKLGGNNKTPGKTLTFHLKSYILILWGDGAFGVKCPGIMTDLEGIPCEQVVF